MLKIENLSFEYIKGVKVFENLFCEKKSGTNIVLSKRGEGKTTLLNLILFPKNNCEITLCGEKLSKTTSKQKVSAVQANYFLQEEKTWWENFQNTKWKNTLPQSFLDTFAKVEKRGEKVKSLSHVEKFSLAVLRSLKKQPSLLICDSALWKMSEWESSQCLAFLDAVAEQFPIPLCILVLERSLNPKTRTVSILQGGKIAETALWEEIQNNPKTTKIAIAFAKYPQNVFAKGTASYYLDGDMVEALGEEKYRISAQNSTTEVEIGGEIVEIKKTNGKVGEKIPLSIPDSAKKPLQ